MYVEIYGKILLAHEKKNLSFLVADVTYALACHIVNIKFTHKHTNLMVSPLFMR